MEPGLVVKAEDRKMKMDQGIVDGQTYYREIPIHCFALQGRDGLKSLWRLGKSSILAYDYR